MPSRGRTKRIRTSVLFFARFGPDFSLNFASKAEMWKSRWKMFKTRLSGHFLAFPPLWKSRLQKCCRLRHNFRGSPSFFCFPFFSPRIDTTAGAGRALSPQDAVRRGAAQTAAAPADGPENRIPPGFFLICGKMAKNGCIFGRNRVK